MYNPIHLFLLHYTDDILYILEKLTIFGKNLKYEKTYMHQKKINNYANPFA